MIERDHLVLVKHAPLVEDLKQYGAQAVQGYYRDPNTPFNIPQSFPPTPPKGQVPQADEEAIKIIKHREIFSNRHSFSPEQTIRV